MIKDSGLILSGFIDFLGNMRHPHFKSSPKAERNFRLLAVLMEMIWLYLQPQGQTRLDANKHSSIVVREESMFTCTTQEDIIVFLCFDFFGTAPEATCPAYKEMSTPNSRSAVEEKEHSHGFQNFWPHSWPEVGHREGNVQDKYLFPSLQSPRAIPVCQLLSGPFSGQESVSSICQWLSPVRPCPAAPWDVVYLPYHPTTAAYQQPWLEATPVIVGLNAWPLFPL